MRKALALIRAWLVLDFFGDARRSGGDGSSLTTTIFTQSFLAFVFAALLYPETPRVPFVAANLCLSSLLIAVGVLGNQDQLERRRADEALVRTAPLGTGIVVLARAGHGAFYVALLTIGMALPPAVLLGCSTNDPLQAIGYVLLACGCSGLATGALGVAMRSFVRLFGHARAALLAATSKAMLLGGGIVMFALGLPHLDENLAAMPIGRTAVELLPPWHVARFLAAPAEQSWRLGVLAAAALALGLMAIAIGNERSPRRTRVASFDPLRSLLRWIARRGPTLGVGEFVATSMWRSAGFRARVLPLLGLPAGMVFSSLHGSGERHGFVFTCLLLQLPAIYLPFLIAFLPRADQPDSGWIFEVTPRLTLGIVRDATWRALVTHVLVPVHGLAAVLLVASTPSLDTVAACLFSLAVAVIAARAMTQNLDAVPFSTREEDTGTDLGALFGAALALGVLGSLFGGALPASLRLVVAGLAVATAITMLARQPVVRADDPRLASPLATAKAPDAAALPSDAERERTVRTASLRGELRAIGVLYVAVCVLPFLVGTMFAA